MKMLFGFFLVFMEKWFLGRNYIQSIVRKIFKDEVNNVMVKIFVKILERFKGFIGNFKQKGVYFKEICGCGFCLIE